MDVRSRTASRLVALVALAGAVPIAAVGAVAIEATRRHAEAVSAAALRDAAELAAARVEAFLLGQEEALRIAAAAAGDDPTRLADVVGEAPTVKRVAALLPGREPPFPLRLDAPALARVRAGQEVRSAPYPDGGGAPALDVCVPGAPRGAGVCATLDLAGLWPLLARIRVDGSGQVLAFDGSGRLLAPGPGGLAPAGSGPASRGGSPPLPEREPAWPDAARFASGESAPPERWAAASGEDVIAGWARLRSLGWSLAVARPAAEALRGARLAQWGLAAVAAVALALSIAVGVAQSRRVLAELAAEERWRLAGRIAAGVSHDLGHRVAILQHLARLADEGDPAQLPRIRDGLRAEVATLRKFVGDFSDLSRDVTVDALPVELGAFAASVVKTAGAQAEAAGVRLRAVVEAVGPAWVHTDRHLLERAVLNLLWNAFEASPRGGEVRVRAVADARHAAIEVEDDGAGIAPERIPRLFDGFASTRRSGGRVGLGLPNVKRIAGLLGAELTVRSAAGKGAAFRLGLARALAPEDDES